MLAKRGSTEHKTLVSPRDQELEYLLIVSLGVDSEFRDPSGVFCRIGLAMAHSFPKVQGQTLIKNLVKLSRAAQFLHI